jgi:hypothetical protein
MDTYFLIVLLGMVLAIAASIYFNVLKKSDTTQNTPIAVPTLITTDSLHEMAMGTDPRALLFALDEKIRETQSEIAHYYIAEKTETGSRIITSEEFLSFIGAQMPSGMLRTLENTFMIGSAYGEPFIVLRSYNFDAFFAGMLAWESSLQSDLDPLFDVPNIGGFIDEVDGNKPIRVHKNNEGEDVLLYSFISSDTVVITASKEALTAIIKAF